MRIGAALVHLSPGPPFPVVEGAKKLVDAGFESLWAPQVIGRGRLVPDPFVALAAAATATAGSGIEVGTATVQVPLHHPADLAHRILSLMLVCGDRLTLGLSPGSTAADFAALDRDHTTRFRDFRSSVERLRGLLAHGRDEHADLAPAPAAGPPPLLLGSWGANVERAAREFDGWIASGHRRSPGEILAAHERFRAAGGRRAVAGYVPARTADELRAAAEALERYAAAGFDDAVLLLAPGGPEPAQVRALHP